MSHDPLCPFFNDHVGRELVRQTGNPCVYCDLIDRVREDEKERILQAAYESAPAQVRQDEVARIYNIGYTEAKRAMKLTWRDYAYVIGMGVMAVLLGLFFRWGS
jgi:hypothetical protein